MISQDTQKLNNILSKLGMDKNAKKKFAKLLVNSREIKNMKEEINESIGSVIPLGFYTLIGNILGNAVDKELLAEFIEDPDHTAHHIELIGHMGHIILDNLDNLSTLVSGLV